MSNRSSSDSSATIQLNCGQTDGQPLAVDEARRSQLIRSGPRLRFLLVKAAVLKLPLSVDNKLDNLTTYGRYKYP